MIISVNWLKKFTNIDLPIDELSSLIGERLVEIENIVDLGAKYSDVLIVKVIEAKHLDDSDHLGIIKIDDGNTVDDIDRDEDGYIQVVCGAPNIQAGQFVAWLPPKSIVPNTFGKNQFILESKKLMGYISNGMIASARELDLFDEHDGILVLEDNLTPGSSFAKVYELDDYILDIENKSLTHRPDCFSIIGFAREVAAISGNNFKTPGLLTNLKPNFPENRSIKIQPKAIIDDPELCARYQAVIVSDADSNKKSPLIVQTYLARIGVRPINAVVDTTNYLMMLTGQPLHAFDYDKLMTVGDGGDIHIRAGIEGETLELLDGRIINISTEDIVIAAGETAVALAGAMGGSSTCIDSATKNIIIESATFNLYKLRATQMRHGIFSEAITRFTKGQPAYLTAPVLFSAIQTMGEWSGAECVGGLIEDYPNVQVIPRITTKTDNLNKILGTEFDGKDIASILGRVEFSCETNTDNGEELTVIPPFWRADIHIPEDIAEEVGRLSGFDNIKSILPTRDFTAVKFSEFDDFREIIRRTLVRAGVNEILTYSFINGDIVKNSGQSVDNSYKIINSISPDLQYYRQTLTPSLMAMTNPNIKQDYDEFALFEINKTHQKSKGLNHENVPVELDNVALIYASKETKNGSAYYQTKYILDYMFKVLDIDVEYLNLDGNQSDPMYCPFEPRLSAIIKSKKTGNKIGVIGEYKKAVSRSFKLPEYASGFEIDLKALFEEVNRKPERYSPISKYPSTSRDICLQVAKDYSYISVVGLIEQALSNSNLLTEITPVDIYRQTDAITKNITVRIKFTSYDRTLKSTEIELEMKNIIDTALSADNTIKVI